MRIGLLASVFFLLFVSEAASVSCMPWVRTFSGQTVDGYMTVRSGRRCNITFRSHGPTETTQIVQRPSNGSASVGAIGRVTIKPAPVLSEGTRSAISAAAWMPATAHRSEPFG
jgi:hypothetical protein